MNFNDFKGDRLVFKAGTTLYIEKETRMRDLYWLSEGYAIEFTLIDGKEEVSAFFSSGDFILPSNRYNTRIESLINSHFLILPWKKLVYMLRNHPETAMLHKEIKKIHLEKVKEYRKGLVTKSVGERYIELIEKLPGIKNVVDAAYIASYLRISLEQYNILCMPE